MINRYKLQAKRPHEDVFTEWCSTDNYEVVERNIKVIESYGWQWQLREGEQEEVVIQVRKRITEAMRSLGERIKEAREAKGINQKELAEKINISASLLCLSEKGKRNISEELLCDIADALDMLVDEIGEVE
jgi:ribosome-binding protein aMBF1 (putative translation factor)